MISNLFYLTISSSKLDKLSPTVDLACQFVFIWGIFANPQSPIEKIFRKLFKVEAIYDYFNKTYAIFNVNFVRIVKGQVLPFLVYNRNFFFSCIFGLLTRKSIKLFSFSWPHFKLWKWNKVPTLLFSFSPSKVLCFYDIIVVNFDCK